MDVFLWSMLPYDSLLTELINVEVIRLWNALDICTIRTHPWTQTTFWESRAPYQLRYEAMPKNFGYNLRVNG